MVTAFIKVILIDNVRFCGYYQRARSSVLCFLFFRCRAVSVCARELRQYQRRGRRPETAGRRLKADDGRRVYFCS